jgi:hypothetical protein
MMHLPVFLFKTLNVSGNVFCLGLQLEHTELGPIDRAISCLRTPSIGLN